MGFFGVSFLFKGAGLSFLFLITVSLGQKRYTSFDFSYVRLFEVVAAFLHNGTKSNLFILISILLLLLFVCSAFFVQGLCHIAVAFTHSVMTNVTTQRFSYERQFRSSMATLQSMLFCDSVYQELFWWSNCFSFSCHSLL